MTPRTAKFLVMCDVHFDAETGVILAAVPDQDELERTSLTVDISGPELVVIKQVRPRPVPASSLVSVSAGR